MLFQANNRQYLSLGTAIGLATMLVGANTPALAQEINEMVVNGSIQQNMTEIETRRRSRTIVDSLSQDEIGALPDITIADSLRRIAGVSTMNNDDIGQFVSVRGVDPNLVPITLNGLTLATTGNVGEGSRRINLQVIPGRAVKQLQVFKSYTPDQESGALGGYINMLPASAYDVDGRRVIVDTFSSYSTYMDVPDDNSRGDSKDSPMGGGVNALYTDTFGDRDQFGLVLTGMWKLRPRTQSNTPRPRRLYFNDAGEETDPESNDWNGHSMPNQYQDLDYTNQFENYGGTARFEYTPNETYYTSLFAYAYTANEQETRNRTRIFGFDDIQNQTATGGNVLNQYADTQWRYNPFERHDAGLQWENVFQLSDISELSVNTGYSRASFLSARELMAFRYEANKRMDYDLDNSDQPFTLTDPEDYIDPSNFGFWNAYRDWRDAEEDVVDSRVDYSFNTGPEAMGFGYDLGVAYRRLDLTRDFTKIQYQRDMDITLEGQSFIPDFSPPGNPYQVRWIDQQRFWNQTIPNRIMVDEASTAEDSFINDYEYIEDIFNAYASVSYATENMSLTAGLRLDRTDFEATMAQMINGELQDQYITKEGDYSEVLPYISGLYSLSDASRIKFGISKTLGRPNPNDIATAERVDDEDFTISRGNPELEPRRSTNFDIGYEHFFNEGNAMFTASAFYKEVKDDILEVGRLEDIDGTVWEISQPINGETTKYKGVELGLVNNSFANLSSVLSNVGASANVTYVDGSTSYIFEGERRDRDDLLNQMKWIGNMAVFYDLGEGSEVRLAYNYQGEYVDSYRSVPWEDAYNGEFDTFDLTLKWSITPVWRLRLEGRNIFSNNRTRLIGPNHEYRLTEMELGSSWYLHLIYRL